MSARLAGTVALCVLALVPWKLSAFLAGAKLELTMSLVFQSGAGESQAHCLQSVPVESGLGLRWALVMRELDGAINLECVPARATAGAGEEGGTTDVVGFRTEGGLSLSVRELMQDERIVQVHVTGQSGMVQASAASPGEPGEHWKIERSIQFGDEGTVHVPLGAGSPDRPLPGDIRETWLRVSLRERVEPELSQYGTVWMESAEEEVNVLLDGGRVGTIPPGETLKLFPVPVGDHDVSFLRGEHLLGRRHAEVRPGRTTVMMWPGGSDAGGPVLEPLGPNAQGFEEFRRQRDGAVVIRVPEGEFLMGNLETERSPLEHSVYLSAFMIDKTGVTWGQYKRFADQTGTPLPPRDPYWGIHDDQPAVFVTWVEARNYCAWAGARLPTEAEREKAARGTDGRMYPWGDMEPRDGLGVFRKSWGYDAPAPVGSAPGGASPYGALDMGGNVWEWCHDWYSDDYYALSPHRDPRGPAQGEAHVVRGGSWDSRPSVLSASCRNWGHRGYRDGDFGFRCAMHAPE